MSAWKDLRDRLIYGKASPSEQEFRTYILGVVQRIDQRLSAIERRDQAWFDREFFGGDFPGRFGDPGAHRPCGCPRCVAALAKYDLETPMRDCGGVGKAERQRVADAVQDGRIPEPIARRPCGCPNCTEARARHARLHLNDEMRDRHGPAEPDSRGMSASEPDPSIVGPPNEKLVEPGSGGSTLAGAIVLLVLALIVAGLLVVPKADAGVRADSLRADLREASAWSAAAADLELYQARRNPDLPYGGVALDLLVDTDGDLLKPKGYGSDHLTRQTFGLGLTTALGARTTFHVELLRLNYRGPSTLPPHETRATFRLRMYLGGK